MYTATPQTVYPITRTYEGGNPERIAIAFTKEAADAIVMALNLAEGKFAPMSGNQPYGYAAQTERTE